MATNESRRFTLLDLMVLLAACTPSLALLRPAAPSISGTFGWMPWQDVALPGTSWLTRGLGSPGFTMDLLIGCVDSGLPWLAIETPAICALRWVRPRPPWRQLVHQPGLAACSAATMGLLALLGLWPFAHRLASLLPGSLVAVAWLGLALARRWQSERSWIDRAGRTLGVAWLATVPLFAWFSHHS